MTPEQIAQRNYNEAMMRCAMQNAAPQPSCEKRLDWLEADASAQRTAILNLEREVKLIAGAVALVGIAATVLSIALEVLT